MAEQNDQEELKDIYQQIHSLQKQINDLQPLPADTEGKIMQKFRLDWNYNSNAIEGNKLTYGETIAFLMEGLTAKGKPLKDHLDIKGHNEAINFMMDMIKENRPLTETDIRNLHSIILVEPYEVKAQTAEGIPTTKRITLGEYKKLPNHVKTVTGEIHYYATPEETPAKMQELMEWYNTEKAKGEYETVALIALFHHRFTAIHPFDDGNGRLSRILMNLMLMQNNYPPIIVKNDDKRNYYAVLNQADNGVYGPVVEYIGNLLIHSLQIYLKGAKGESIEEESDLDKEIALFKKGFENEDRIKVTKHNSSLLDLYHKSISQLFLSIEKKSRDLNPLFAHSENSVSFRDGNNITGSANYNNDFSIEFYFGTYFTKEKNLKENELKFIPDIHYEHTFIAFKKSETPFDVTLVINVRLETYKYHVTIGNISQEILNKFYHEQLSEEEIQHITSVAIKSVMDAIKKQSGK